MEKTLELYIHIPFCVHKCNYCDFLSGCSQTDDHMAYIRKLAEEIANSSVYAANYLVTSIFIGGGTPSMIDPDLIKALMKVIYQYYHVAKDAEITIECNPASAMRHKFAKYREAGINRLSIGLQSADNAELKELGRMHSYEEFLKSYQSARMEGFRNINVDLMNCIPSQTKDSWRKTLRSVLMMRPEHVSVYNLIIEPHTPFGKLKEEGRLKLPGEDEMTLIDAVTDELTEAQKYHRYEVSNYAKEGFECRHNIGYWTQVPYLGFGLGASSYFGGSRYKNSSDMKEYMDTDFSLLNAENFLRSKKEVEKLSIEEMMREFMILGLRMTRGVSDLDFFTSFGRHLEDVYGEIIAKYERFDLMEKSDSRLKFTKRGMDVSNQVLSEF